MKDYRWINGIDCLDEYIFRRVNNNSEEDDEFNESFRCSWQMADAGPEVNAADRASDLVPREQLERQRRRRVDAAAEPLENLTVELLLVDIVIEKLRDVKGSSFSTFQC